MKILYSLKTSFTALSLPLICSLALTSCGGGGGGGDGDDTPDTTRPKTLDGTIITLPGGVAFSFSRNTGTSPALTNGETETGSFVYSPPAINLQQFQNINGDMSDISFPDALSDRTYTYQAVNENSGVITLTGVSSNNLNQTGIFNAANQSFTYYFHSDSGTALITSPATNPSVQMDITFNNNGGITVSVSSIVLSIVGSNFPNLDTTLPISPAFTLAGGGSVPFNFNPEVDPNRPSAIVPESLNGLLVFFTNGAPNPADDFRVQFSSDFTFDNINNPNIDEVGSGLQRVGANSDLTLTGGESVGYTWRRIPGTDNATMVLSLGGNTFDGSYELQFTSENTGSYIGTVDDGTTDVGQVSGTFITRSD